MIARTAARSGCAPIPLPIDADATRSVAAVRRARGAFEEELLLRRRREHLILRVDRADLSKNVLRGFTAFDLFLEQHPEFRERRHVRRPADAVADRRPEYAEYLEKIEALVAVVNHQHGTPDWMPIDLSCATTSRRRWPPTSTTTCCSSTRCSTG